jgi:hypothetical protein
MSPTSTITSLSSSIMLPLGKSSDDACKNMRNSHGRLFECTNVWRIRFL